jgi:hypothetical protein
MSTIRKLTPEILADLEELAAESDCNFTDGRNKDLRWKGFCIVEIDYPKLIYNCGGYAVFTAGDVNKLRNWHPNKEDLYYKDYYRVDLDSVIFIFQYGIMEDKVILSGNVLEKSFDTRLDLISFKQNSLLMELIHG